MNRTLPPLIAFLFATAVARAQPPTGPNTIAAGGNSSGYDMAPETRLEVVQAAVAKITLPTPAGPFAPTWESLAEHYRVPAWFYEAKFGLFMHWGLYAVPAHHNEWYEKHMYGADRAWHVEHFGPQDKFGYKDFIPLFTCDKFDPKAWAELFKRSGAKFVVPTAQHHDNFALWDSRVTPFNAKAMGPHRDLIGELAQAVRAQGLKFGVSNHGIENFQFINPPPELAADLQSKHADLYDPKWADFYHVADRSDAACEKFLVDWFERNAELIDKYQPDMLWFDNGVDQRYLDPLKLRVAAYYYNRAVQWGKEVSLSTKKAAFAPSGNNVQTIGSIIDFEKIGPRSPSGIRTGAWQVDHPIGSTWGYTSTMKVSGPAEIIAALADTVSKNGTLLLNLSPRADGTIPPEQQQTLLAVGDWLAGNGEAIYGTHNWTTFGEDGARGEGVRNVRFTVKGDALYAIAMGEASANRALTLTALATHAEGDTKVTAVSLLGESGDLSFTQDGEGLHVKLPATIASKHAFTLKILGVKVNPPANPPDGNPQAAVAASTPATPAPAPDLDHNLPPTITHLNPALPTLFIAGDSTAARGRGESQQGWGVPFASYFDPAKVNVANRAQGGTSSRTYQTGSQWRRLIADVKPGDIVLIQFGHNDGGALNRDIPPAPLRARGSIPGIGEEIEEIDNVLTKKHEVVHTFGWYLRKMIAETKAKGATPIVVGLTVRNVWNDGRIERGPDRYSAWSYEVAKAENVPFLDLTDAVADEFETLGQEKTKTFYPQDHTHFNALGADLHAKAVVARLKGLRPDPVAKLLSAKGEAVPTDETAWLRLPFPENPKLPSLLLAGDSTVRNGGGDGKGGQWGWGDYIAPYFDLERINIVNRAVGGTGIETFRALGHWQRLLSLTKPGDFVMIQFGHNDGPPRGPLAGVGDETEERTNPKTKEARTVHTWGWYLRQDIAEVRAHGATPIVCSLVPRKIWKDGKIEGHRDSFAGWAQQVAEAEHVDFIDLEGLIAQRYEALGQDKVNALFADEHTHTTLEGAKLNAEVVADALRKLPKNPLGTYWRETKQ